MMHVVSWNILSHYSGASSLRWRSPWAYNCSEGTRKKICPNPISQFLIPCLYPPNFNVFLVCISLPKNPFCITTPAVLGCTCSGDFWTYITKPPHSKIRSCVEALRRGFEDLNNVCLSLVHFGKAILQGTVTHSAHKARCASVSPGPLGSVANEV